MDDDKPEWLRIYEAQVAAGMEPDPNVDDGVRDEGDIDLPSPNDKPVPTPQQAAKDALERLAFVWQGPQPPKKEMNPALKAGLKANQWLHEPPPKETTDWYQKEYPELKTFDEDLIETKKRANSIAAQNYPRAIVGKASTSTDNMDARARGQAETLYKGQGPEKIHKALEGSRLRETGGGSAIEKAVKALREKKE